MAFLSSTLTRRSNVAWLLLLLLPVATQAFLTTSFQKPSTGTMIPITSSSSGINERIRASTTTTTQLQAARWQSHVSTHMDALSAVDRLLENVTLKSDEINLAFLFVGQAHAAEFEAVVQHAYEQVQQKKKEATTATNTNSELTLITILAGGVIGENVEIDEPERPGMSLLVGEVPEGAKLDIFEYSNTDNNDKNDLLKLDDKFDSCLAFCDPWAPVENLLMEYLHRPGRVVAGGISCPYLADQASLAINDRCLVQGSMMGVGFSGTLGLQTIVAQGCRPIGSVYTITACEGNLVTELDHEPAIEVLKALSDAVPREEFDQIESGLLCGVAKASSTTGSSGSTAEDFLSRQILGFAPSLNGIAVGTSNIQTGDSFCFQVRDGTTAQQDLKLMVQRAKTARLFDNTAATNSKVGQPVAALQISCVARGRGMFDGVPNVDLSSVKRLVESNERGPVVGGFFANGEIGPLGLAGFSTTTENNGNSFLHSFTTVAAILCEYSSMKGSGKEETQTEDSLDAWG